MAAAALGGEAVARRRAERKKAKGWLVAGSGVLAVWLAIRGPAGGVSSVLGHDVEVRQDGLQQVWRDCQGFAQLTPNMLFVRRGISCKRLNDFGEVLVLLDVGLRVLGRSLGQARRGSCGHSFHEHHHGCLSRGVSPSVSSSLERISDDG